MKYSQLKKGGMRNAESGMDEVQKPSSAEAMEGGKPQETREQKDRVFYVKMLASEECLCGAEKLRGNSFCRPCYLALPEGMRRDLYRGIGHGYEPALDAATVYLQRNVW